MKVEEMKDKLEEAFIKAGLKFEKDVPLGELMLRSDDEVKFKFVKEAAMHFDNEEIDLSIEEFREEFTKEDLDKLVLYFSIQYSKENVK
nr:hypothetical protein [uncultured Cellulosilyticum sp.]